MSRASCLSFASLSDDLVQIDLRLIWMQGPRGITRNSLGQLVSVRERLTCSLTHLTHVAAVCPKGLTLTNDTSTCIDMGIVDIGKKAYSDPNLNAALNLTRVRHDTFVNRLLEVISRLRSN